MLGVLLTVPIFTALESVRDPLAAFALVFAALLIVTGYTSINAVVKAELFPAHIRALGVALPYALANTVFGGTAEYVALWFKDAGIERAFYWYVTGMIGAVADRLPQDARHQAAQPDLGGLGSRRHCERSEAIQSGIRRPLDRCVASLLAMTRSAILQLE